MEQLIIPLKKSVGKLKDWKEADMFLGICGSLHITINSHIFYKNIMKSFDNRYKKVFPKDEIKLDHYYPFGVSKTTTHYMSWTSEWCKKNNIPIKSANIDILLYAWYEPRIKFMEDWIKDLEK
jgi:hypothetical protein